MKPYKTVSAPAEASFTERGSEFISAIFPAENEEQALERIRAIKKRHSAASHNVYAYILRENNTVRFSDDGEPHGTAGTPVLEVLKKEGLTDVVIVVTRYFGGVLLGAGGLTRAYSRGAALVAGQADIIVKKSHTVFELELSYRDYQKIEAYLHDSGVKNNGSVFAENIRLSLEAETERFGPIKNGINELTGGKAVFTISEKPRYGVSG